MNYEPVMGLEVHAELATRSKVFCGCATGFGAPANTHTCPVCLGLPGVLPVLNERALELALRAALALDCRILSRSTFDRKNYYYPDLPKNYQISQNYFPFAEGGRLEIDVDGDIRAVRIDNVHMEEDAGKNLHSEDTGLADSSLVDYNRAGVPLLEIVSEPDMHSLAEVEAYMTTLTGVLRYTGASDCKMEEGSLRFEANVSMRPRGTTDLGPRVEMKNLNSFKMALAALEYEITRQQEVLEGGGRVTQETRLWDSAAGVTRSMRSKEEAHDYRYFPEPDLVPVALDEAWIESVKAELPEFPAAKRRRYVEEYGLPAYDAGVITSDPAVAGFFEEAVAAFPDAKAVSNWVMGELLRAMNESGIGMDSCRLAPVDLAGLLQRIKKGELSTTAAKKVFAKMFASGRSAGETIREEGLAQVSDERALMDAVNQVLEENEKTAGDYRAGKERALGFLVGQVMKATRGKANPQVVNKLLVEALGGKKDEEER